jgi:hypothetical protein
MFHGVHGDFRWLESGSHRIHEVLKKCPDLVTGKGLVVTAFTSAAPSPRADQTERGRQDSDSGIYISAAQRPGQFPYEIFKEFYIFSSMPPQQELAPFSIYDWFTLGPAVAAKVQANSRWDLRRIQRTFWQQLEQAAPESYLACGSRLILVTRNSEYFSCVLNGLSKPSPAKAAGA